jgi:small neutral amino acid transporter SnatA (MarC family)
MLLYLLLGTPSAGRPRSDRHHNALRELRGSLMLRIAECTLTLAIAATHIVIGLTSHVLDRRYFGLIKESGVTLFARIAGLLLAAIAVEMIVASIKGFFNL